MTLEELKTLIRCSEAVAKDLSIDDVNYNSGLYDHSNNFIKNIILWSEFEITAEEEKELEEIQAYYD